MAMEITFIIIDDSPLKPPFYKGLPIAIFDLRIFAVGKQT
jgi:hypothetical protein